MGYLNIYVTKDATLTVKNQQLLLQSKDQKMDYPLEDVNSVMIENVNTVISTHALSKLAEFGILTFICNQNHLPNGLLLPFCKHYHTLTHFNLQNEINAVLQKKLWNTIVKNKIMNQSDVLHICGIENQKLQALEKLTVNGDVDNNEAKASLIYFKDLFGNDFARRAEIPLNGYLNYGYAIIRAFVARSITAHGLLPFLGIFHNNQYNQFNLADDLMEVFRPVVDLYVKNNLATETKFTTVIKAQLYNLINYDVLVGGQKQTLNYAIELLVQSFIKSLTMQQNMLKEIKIMPLAIHKYE